MDNLKTYTDLLNIINNHADLIVSQNKMIAGLINENAENENMISELMQKERYFYVERERSFSFLLWRCGMDGEYNKY